MPTTEQPTTSPPASSEPKLKTISPDLYQQPNFSYTQLWQHRIQSFKKLLRKLFKLSKYLLIFLIIAVPLSIFAYKSYHYYLDSRIQSEISRLHAQGQPVTPQDINLFYAIPTNTQVLHPNLADSLQPHLDNLMEYERKHMPPQYYDQIPDFLLPFFDRQVPTQWPSHIQSPPKPLLDHVQQYLAITQNDINAIIALPDAPARWPVDFSQGSSVLLPHLAELRIAHHHLMLTHWLALHENRPQDSVDALVASRKLADTLKLEPCLISQFVRVRIMFQTNNQIIEALSSDFYNDAQLQQLFQAAAPIDNDNMLHRALVGERAWLLDILQETHKYPLTARHYNSSTGPIRAYINKHLGIYQHEQLHLINLFDILLNDLQNQRYNFPNYQNALDSTSSMYDVLHTMSPNLALRHTIIPKNHQAATAAQLTIATKRYYLAHRQLPQQLSDLIPDFLPDHNTIPTDPFSNAPFQYIIIPQPNNTDNTNNTAEPAGFLIHFLSQTHEHEIRVYVTLPNHTNQPDVRYIHAPSTQQIADDNLKIAHEAYFENLKYNITEHANRSNQSEEDEE